MKADKTQVSRLLKTARGQIDGLLRMVEEDRYCPDILLQGAQQTLGVLGREDDAALHACLLHAGHHGSKVDHKLRGGVVDQGEIRVDTFGNLLIELNLQACLLNFCHSFSVVC